VRVDDIPYCPRNWQPGTPLRLLIAATFPKKKEISYALAALGATQRQIPVQLTAIGNASAEARSQAEKARILAALNMYGLTRYIQDSGFREHEALMREAYAHHVFLFPSVAASNADTGGSAQAEIIQMAASRLLMVSTRHCDILNVLPASAELVKDCDGQDSGASCDGSARTQSCLA
jgi:colanic acid/amylovoran biosynthesis glycosyltransferase